MLPCALENDFKGPPFMTQRVLEILSPSFLPLGQIPAGAGSMELFGNDHPLALEIGCGTGTFVAEMARRRPEVNFLGIDIYNKGCLKTCSKIDAASLGNVRVCRAEARELLVKHLAPESLSAVYVNCPDPWPKKRHRKRRLVGAGFLDLLLRALRPGGDFYFVSDVADYAAEVAEVAGRKEGLSNALSVPVAFDLPDYPLSKYMTRFRDLGEPLHFIHFRKEDGFRADDSLPPGPDRGFRLNWERASND